MSAVQNNISAMKFGGSDVDALYIGNDKIWDSSGVPIPIIPYAGFLYDKAVAGQNSSFTIVDAEGYAVSPVYSMVNGHTYRVKFGFKQQSGLSNPYGFGIKDANGNQLLLYGTSSADTNYVREFTLSNSSAATGQCTFLTSALHDCFVYDITAGVYLFKGINVTT